MTAITNSIGSERPRNKSGDTFMVRRFFIYYFIKILFYQFV